MNLDIQKLKKEYDELNLKLQDPSLPKQPNEFEKVSQRFSEITEIIDLHDKLTETLSQLDEARDLVDAETTEMKSLAEEEVLKLEKNATELEAQLTELTVEKDANDRLNALIEIRAGSGGDEAAIFAADLFRMYQKFAEGHGFRLELLSSSRTGNGGFKEVIAMINGKDAYGLLKFESGVHRVQRVPSTESSGRIHTSAASVVVLPEVDDDIEVEIKDEDLKIDVYRSSGPGGQSVNTTDSAVRITHKPSGIVVSMQDEKSQHKNKAKALTVLKSKLYDIKLQEELDKDSEKRMDAIKTGDRSAKIKTYNYPQSRVTDHRIKKNWYNLTQILEGAIGNVLEETKKELSGASK